MQKELAERVGCTQQAITQWESGKQEPRKQFRERLAKVFHITEAELYGATPTPRLLTPHAGELQQLTQRYTLSTMQLPLRIDSWTGETEVFDLIGWRWVKLTGGVVDRQVVGEQGTEHNQRR